MEGKYDQKHSWLFHQAFLCTDWSKKNRLVIAQSNYTSFVKKLCTVRICTIQPWSGILNWYNQSRTLVTVIILRVTVESNLPAIYKRLKEPLQWHHRNSQHSSGVLDTSREFAILAYDDITIVIKTVGNFSYHLTSSREKHTGPSVPELLAPVQKNLFNKIKWKQDMSTLKALRQRPQYNF